MLMDLEDAQNGSIIMALFKEMKTCKESNEYTTETYNFEIENSLCRCKRMLNSMSGSVN